MNKIPRSRWDKFVIFFRGRNTDNIMNDARQFGLLTDSDVPIVICRKDDALRQDGDIEKLPEEFGEHDAILIANGGTTIQQVSTTIDFVGMKNPHERNRFIVDIQRDHSTVIWYTGWLPDLILESKKFNVLPWEDLKLDV